MGLSTITGRRPAEHWEVVRISMPPGLLRYVVEKGSVAVDGVSLTVNDVAGQSFGVNVIPHTAAHTTLGLRTPGDADIAAGRAAVVVDDADRENEGDLIFAASKATAALMAFTIRHTSGVICVPMPGEELDRLQLPLMTAQNKERMRTAFTVSVPAT